jgi:hypothetical protein
LELSKGQAPPSLVSIFVTLQQVGFEFAFDLRHNKAEAKLKVEHADDITRRAASARTKPISLVSVPAR